MGRAQAEKLQPGQSPITSYRAVQSELMCKNYSVRPSGRLAASLAGSVCQDSHPCSQSKTFSLAK